MKYAKIALITLLAVSTTVQAANIKLCFEAENAMKIVPVLIKAVPGTSPSYSGKGYVEIPAKAPVGIGSATYRLNVATPGQYYIFARTFWGNGLGNSILLLINGQERMLGEDGLYGKWHWACSRTPVALKDGTNTIVLKNRESGVQIDQLFFCTDSAYEPTKIRPITHDGATGKAISQAHH